VLKLIDVIKELNEYRPIDLNLLTGKEEGITDDIRNSLMLYNKGIESLKSGSEDIAVIELKKAVALNPNFHEAWNLLGLCFIYMNEEEKAVEIFERVARQENNGVNAVKYLSQLNSEIEISADKTKTKASSKNSLESKKLQNLKKNRLHNYIMIGTLSFAIGLLAAVLFNTGGQPENGAVVDHEKDNQIKGLMQQVENLNRDIERLNAENQSLKTDLSAAVNEADYYKAAIKLEEAEDLYKDKDYEKAADILLLMKSEIFAGEELERFESLKGKVMPAAAWTVYERGYKAYNNGQNEEAIKNLEKVPVYNEAFERMDVVLYYLGRSSQRLNDSRNALAFFQKLLDTYPESNYADNAQARIRSINAQP
jgi:tetratricopeptide (TPR) repeat protein